ncbi:hypothetical protein Tco_0818500 [Tanacetum coccineum]
MAMAITGIEDRKYWNWVPTEESRFLMVLDCSVHAECVFLLLNVISSQHFDTWVDIYCLIQELIDLLFWVGGGGGGGVCYTWKILQKVRATCLQFSTHPWLGHKAAKPVRFELSTLDGQEASSEYILDACSQNGSNGNHKHGCWIQYKVGGIYVDNVSIIILRDLKADRRKRRRMLK